jgi:hypothetical protein
VMYCPTTTSRWTACGDAAVQHRLPPFLEHRPRSQDPGPAASELVALLGEIDRPALLVQHSPSVGYRTDGRSIPCELIACLTGARLARASGASDID